MAQGHLAGKLAVILHADIAGSTQMVQRDEHLAHERIQDTFREFSKTINDYSGQVLESRGDALLAEFERPSDAVTAALAFQSSHAEYLASIDDELKPELRIGIAMGEVVIADDTITGAGVVMAQRVEQLAETGGLSITAAVRESLSGRLSIEIENLGPQDLKGFDEPVGVYKVSRSEGTDIPQPERLVASIQPRTPWLKVSGSAVVVLLILAGLYFWIGTEPALEETASVERMAFPLPDKPSIAVLPFINMSNDPEQDFFAYGMTDDLITDISKVSGLFVVSRNSVARYKGKTVDIRRVAEELGVRYVMEGSVRRVGNDVRINAQLIDALSGGHEWAERYDGSLDDVFAVQDQIIASIVDELEVVLIGGEEAAISEIQTTNTEAYDAYLRGWERYRQGTPEDLGKAITFLRHAIELDPDYAQAHAALAAGYWKIVENGWWSEILDIRLSSRAVELSRTTLRKAMEQPSALSHQIASERSAYFRRSPKEALSEAELAIKADSNDPAGHLAMANALVKAKRADEALEFVYAAMRLDPLYPAFYLTRLGQAQFAAGHYQDAVGTLEKAIKRNPGDEWNFVYLAATHGQLGNQQEAEAALARANELRAKAGWGILTSQNTRRTNDLYGNPGRNYFKWVGDYKPLRGGLQKAGVKSEADWRSRIKEDASGTTVEGATSIDAKIAKELHDRGVPFVDVYIQWFDRRIPGAFFLDMYTFEFNEPRLARIAKKNQEVVIYSSRSSDQADYFKAPATARAVNWGYEKVYYFHGGIDEWEAAGYLVDRESK